MSAIFRGVFHDVNQGTHAAGVCTRDACVPRGSVGELHSDLMRNDAALVAFGDQTADASRPRSRIQRQFVTHIETNRSASGIQVAANCIAYSSASRDCRASTDAFFQKLGNFADSVFASLANCVCRPRQRQPPEYSCPIRPVEHFVQTEIVIEELAFMNRNPASHGLR